MDYKTIFGWTVALALLAIPVTNSYAAEKRWNWQEVTLMTYPREIQAFQKQLNQFDPSDVEQRKHFAELIVDYTLAIKNHPTLHYKPGMVNELQAEALAVQTGIDKRFFLEDPAFQNFVAVNHLGNTHVIGLR